MPSSDFRPKKIEISVMFDVVRIELHCADNYMAQVVYDDVVDRITSPAGLSIKMTDFKEGIKRAGS